MSGGRDQGDFLVAPTDPVAASEAPPPPAEPPPHFLGHRERLRHRFLAAGDFALRDDELLELLLFRSIPRRDTKALAKTLIKRFGSFAEVLGAPLHLLKEIKGVGENVATDLKIVEASLRRMTRGSVLKREVLSSWSAVLDYCRASIAFGEREEFHILFLDKKNAVITAEKQQTGTVDHTPAYPREVVRRALELSSSALILVHNHPSGDPTPSDDDVRMTRQIIDIAKPLGIAVHDHVVIGKQGHTSLRGLGKI